ncbi:MAG: 16S rRNA (adenine(1518)-N(6)/adenine(1519)-N(6))-dimethyltransferase RsmA [Candidatus Nanopelagicales bacterium]
MADALLGAAEIRALATELGLHPTKQWGQNFVIDANTVRRIVKTAGIDAHDVVVEIGPGLGSLTLALLQSAQDVVVVEIDPALAARLPQTVRKHLPERAAQLRVVQADAMQAQALPLQPTALVANLPYNVSVPVLLHFLEAFPSITRALVMVQLEVAQRLAAEPGSRTYGVPSAKARWYGDVRQAGHIGRNVFWPAPNVDSGLVSFTRTQPPRLDVTRKAVFAVIDAAFAQRRKTLRAALAGWAGSAPRAEQILRQAGVDPQQRGEQLSIADFAAIAAAHESHT